MSLLPCLLVPVVAVVTQSSVNMSDIAILLFCIFALAEDGLRFNCLGKSPIIAFKADLIWFLFAAAPVVMFLTVTSLSESQFLLLSILGPVASFIYLRRSSQFIIDGIEKNIFRNVDRLYLLLGSILLTVCTIAFITLLTHYKGENWLKEWRTVVLIVSPIQALSSILWLRNLIESSQSESFESTLKSIRRGFVKAIPVIIMLVAFAIFFQRLSFPDSRRIDVTVLFIAMSIPVFNAVMYPSNILMRSLGLYRHLFILVSLNSIVLPMLVWIFRKDLNLITLFGVQFLSITLLHLSYIVISRKREKQLIK